MTFTRLRSWFRLSYVSEFRFQLTRIERRLAALTEQGVTIMAGLEDIKAAVGELKIQVGRATSELRDLADKVESVDPAERAALAEEIRGLATGLGATVDAVDTDGSSPAQEPPVEG